MVLIQTYVKVLTNSIVFFFKIEGVSIVQIDFSVSYFVRI